MKIAPMNGEARLGEYTLVYNYKAFCDLESRAGMNMPILLQSMATGLGFAQLRDFVWAGLAHRPDVTDDDILSLLDEQGYEASALAVSKGVTAFFNKSKTKPRAKAA